MPTCPPHDKVKMRKHTEAIEVYRTLLLPYQLFNSPATPEGEGALKNTTVSNCDQRNMEKGALPLIKGMKICHFQEKGLLVFKIRIKFGPGIYFCTNPRLGVKF